MAWEVEYTDQFEEWYLGLDIDQQGHVDFVVGLLEIDGPLLKRPYADTVNGSRFLNMKELRVKQPPLRMFFAFDPRRTAILLIGGDKSTLLTGRKNMATKPWRELRKRSKLTDAQRAEIDGRVALEVIRMRLPDLRKARHLSQATIADVLDIAQGDVSKIERRTDVYVRTLRRYVEAAGGTLRILAEFPDADPIEIDGFGDIEPPATTKRPAKTREAPSIASLAR